MARGDHIRVRRLGGVYSHHGIDMGDGTVIHFDGHPFRRKDVLVRQSTMEEFLAGGQLVTVACAEDPLEADLVCEAARQRLGESGYRLFLNNCEHFATACHAGRPHSRQVRRAVKAAVHTAAGVAVLAGAALAAGAVARQRRKQTSAG